MSKKTLPSSVPPAAMILLKFIGGIEAPMGYETVYDNHQDKLPEPLTSMTVSEVLQAQRNWTSRFGSSASGYYQIMRATLLGIQEEVSNLPGSARYDGELQDRLGYYLLVRRGYEKFIAGQIGIVQFGKALAQEWASFPVLADCQGQKRAVRRGQSYYAGDGINKALVMPDRVEAVLRSVLAAAKTDADTGPLPVPKPENDNPAPAAPAEDPVPTRPSAGSGLAAAVAAVVAGGAAVWGLLSDLPCQWLGVLCGG